MHVIIYLYKVFILLFICIYLFDLFYLSYSHIFGYLFTFEIALFFFFIPEITLPREGFSTGGLRGNL